MNDNGDSTMADKERDLASRRPSRAMLMISAAAPDETGARHEVNMLLHLRVAPDGEYWSAAWAVGPAHEEPMTFGRSGEYAALQPMLDHYNAEFARVGLPCVRLTIEEPAEEGRRPCS